MTLGLVDNWTLQEVGELLRDGASPANTCCLQMTEDCTDHRFASTPRSLVQVECLGILITQMILQDRLVVDEGYVAAWSGVHRQTDNLLASGLVLPLPMDTAQTTGSRAMVKEHLVQSAVTTPLLRRLLVSHSPAVARRDLQQAYFSQIVLGGAGYLEASSHHRAPYTAHPSRALVFTGSSGVPNASELTLEWAAREREKHLGQFARGADLLCLNLALPPLFAQVLADSRTIDQVFEVAMQLRSDMGDLREWLDEFQSAIDAANAEALAGYQKTLDGLSKFLDSKRKTGSGARLGASLLGFLKFDLAKIPALSDVQYKFGVKAHLQKLVLGSGGRSVAARCAHLLGAPSGDFVNLLVKHLGSTRRHSGVPDS